MSRNLPVQPFALSDSEFATRIAHSRIEQAKKLIEDPNKDDRVRRQKCVPCYYHRGMAGQAFTPYHCEICLTEYSHHNTATPKLCTACAEHNGLCEDCGADIEGREHLKQRTTPLEPAPGTKEN